MRKLLAVTFILLLCSCHTTKYAIVKTATMIDYARYAEKGFFLTEVGFVSFDYTPVGSFSATVSDGFEVLGKGEEESVVTFKGLKTLDSKIYADTPTIHTIYDALDFAVEKAKESGADGIIGLKIAVEGTTISTKTYDFESANPETKPKEEGNTYYITGMAIKRK